MDLDAQILLADIRMDGVGFSVARLDPPFCLAGVGGPVSLCYVARGGPLWLEVDAGQRGLTRLAPGTVVGLSGVVDHWFKSSRDLSVRGAKRLAPTPLAGDAPPGSPTGPGPAGPGVELLVGHAPMEALAFTNTINGAVIIPPDEGRIARRLRRAIEGIEDELRDPAPLPGTSGVVRRLSETILMNIARWVSLSAGETVTSPLGALADVRVMRALSAAAKAPLRDWTVAALAEVAGMSRTAFAERFHGLTGVTPLRMVARLRLRRAQEGLADGAASLETVGAMAGYASAAAFVRAFRRAYGVTPARWRADHRRGATARLRTIDQ
jgi:AraC-like DNA-binding protein